MFRIIVTLKRAGLAAALPVFGCAILLAGCGNNQIDSSASSAPPPGGSEVRVAASGPAISEKLTFEQLALDSPVSRVQSKDGPPFLHFSYTNRDGKVYKCELPEAMSKGSYSPEEWYRTFNVYRLPQVIKQKPMPKKDGQGEVADFPFISPKPMTEPAVGDGQTPSSEPASSPNMPSMPSPPAGAEGVPNRAPMPAPF